jgi:hypothetical protein
MYRRIHSRITGRGCRLSPIRDRGLVLPQSEDEDAFSSRNVLTSDFPAFDFLVFLRLCRGFVSSATVIAIVSSTGGLSPLSTLESSLLTLLSLFSPVDALVSPLPSLFSPIEFLLWEIISPLFDKLFEAARRTRPNLFIWARSAFLIATAMARLATPKAGKGLGSGLLKTLEGQGRMVGRLVVQKSLLIAPPL